VFLRACDYVSYAMFINYKKGEIGHLKVEMRAIEKGFTVCYPRVESRFDMILVDDTGKCFKAQVKYTDHEPTQSDNAIIVSLTKQTRNTGKRKRYTKEEVDVVLAYIPKMDKILWIGPDLFDNKATLTFRMAPSKNNQTTGTRNISDFVW